MRADTDQLSIAIESIAGAPFAEGNSVKILRNGDEIFPEMLKAIREAERTIDFVTFVFWTGEVAREFANSLIEKAREGLRVRVILDGFGTRLMDESLVEELQAAGAQVERFRPVVRWKFWEADHRTHRKILICDDRVGFTGGVGIASEWEGDARNPDEWRDTHFRIEGPAVLGLKAAFLADWRDCGHRIGRDDVTIGRPVEAGNTPLAVLDASAHIGFNTAERLLEALVASAQQTIKIQTPYFNPPDELVDAIQEARRRGVAVDILLPGPHIDKGISSIVALERAQPLIHEGVHVWEYQPTMMHVKAVLVDDVVSLIGSVNFNRRSVEKDEEVAVVAIDPELTRELTADFEKDLSHSLPLAGTAARPKPWHRLLTTLLRPLRREF